MSHVLYLARLGEQEGAEFGVPDGPLSERGVQQAKALADRLADVPLEYVWCSPLDRGVQTARLVAGRHAKLQVEESVLLMDCVPCGPTPDTPGAYDAYFGSQTAEQIEAGSAQMADATAEFLSNHRDAKVELLVTHNPVISWFVREALDAPSWRWLSLYQAHCGLSVLVRKPGRPWSLVAHNDVSHLPQELRSGLPEGYAL